MTDPYDTDDPCKRFQPHLYAIQPFLYKTKVIAELDNTPTLAIPLLVRDP
jgi:hypothetical protein